MSAAARAILAGARYEDQFHLPLAWLRLSIQLAEGDQDGAVEAATEILDRYDLSLATPRYAWPALAGAAAAAVASPELAERVRVQAEKLEVFGPVQRAWQLTVAAFDQMTWPDDGNHLGRVTEWDLAARAWESLHQPYETAAALLAAAEAALSGNAPDRETAAERLRQAAPLAAGLRAAPLTESITALARRAGISLRPDAPAPEPDHLGLTDREFEVLRLVADGHSNREIAADLFISPKTASVHVSNILAKLSVATRGEAAARAHTLRLFG
jgi:DNA-binding CsgD family transcriptional regulator